MADDRSAKASEAEAGDAETSDGEDDPDYPWTGQAAGLNLSIHDDGAKHRKRIIQQGPDNTPGDLNVGGAAADLKRGGTSTQLFDNSRVTVRGGRGRGKLPQEGRFSVGDSTFNNASVTRGAGN